MQMQLINYYECERCDHRRLRAKTAQEERQQQLGNAPKGNTK